MIEPRVKGLHQFLVLGQIAILVAFFRLWHTIWFAVNTPADPTGQAYTVYCLLLAAGLLIEAQSRGWDAAGVYEKSLLKHLPVTLRQVAFAVGALLVFLVVAKDHSISRSFLLTLIPGLYAVLLAGNHLLPRFLCRLFFQGSRKARILLIGSLEKADKLEPWLARKSDFGFHAVGILCENKTVSSKARNLPVLGTPSDLDRLIAEHAISHVILLDPPGSPGFDPRLVQTVHARGARLLVLSNVDELFRHPVNIVDEDGLKFFTFFQEPLESPFNRALKRTLDIAVALPVVLFILPPVSALVWILQRVQSPGPVFYKQSRAGIQNRSFTMIKFRSMHAANPAESRAATRGDGRVFASGRWLRRFSLDELPQFLNVLRGEMSVVGPRPHMIEHNDEFARVMNNYHVRAFVKPGVTGLAQVRGFRGETRTVGDIATRLQSDMVYLENWSPVLDCAIILRTVWQMFFPPAKAY